MHEFLLHFMELLRDPAHAAFELFMQLLIDGLILGILWPLIKRAIRREHKVIDYEHGIAHPPKGYENDWFFDLDPDAPIPYSLTTPQHRGESRG